MVDLGSVVDLNPSSSDPVSLFGSDEFVYIDISAVEGGTGAVSFETRLAPLAAPSRARRVVVDGDVLVSTVRPNLKAFALLRNLPDRVLASTGFAVLRAKLDHLLPPFLIEIAFSDAVLSQLTAKMGKGQYPSVTATDIAGIRIPLPPLEIQRCVAADCAAIDLAVAAAAEDLTGASLGIESLVQDVQASSHPRLEIDHVALAVQYGLSEKMNESGIGYKIFRMNEIAQRRMVDGGQMKYADISPDEFAKLKLNKGDILFNRTNGSADHVGKVGMFDLDGDYCFASYLVRVVPDLKKVLPEFLVLMMASEHFRQEALAQAVKSAGQININATKMRSIKVPVPPLPEQKRMVAKVRKLEQQIADALAVIAAAPARKQAILQKYL
jgi:restriction endonuclease S subunit